MLATKEAEKTDQAGTPPTDDNLVHILCTPCEMRAKSKAKPPRALCGKTKYAWSRGRNAEGIECVVCWSYIGKECPICGQPQGTPA